MTVDHKSMWRRPPIQTYFHSHQWTWVTSRNATHKTPRSPSPLTTAWSIFFPPIILENFSSISQKVSPVGQSSTECQFCFLTKDHCNPLLYLNLHSWPRRQQSGFKGEQKPPSSWFTFFKSQKSSYCLCGWDCCKLNTICWHLMPGYNMVTLSTGHRRQQS